MEYDVPKWLKTCLEAIANGRQRQFIVTPYPDPQKGWVVESKKTLQQMKEEIGDDEWSRGEPIALKDHTASVVMEARRLAKVVLPAETAAAVATAAHWHDVGKADERFQALLFAGDVIRARLSPVLRAKGEFTPSRQRKEQYVNSRLPDGFRHELTSLLLAESGTFDHRDLVLHLIASHHGYCRPFAPVVVDESPQDLLYAELALTAEERKTRVPHLLERGVAERFWRLTRRYGWWGLAYLEALLRLADWKVSSEEQKKSAEKNVEKGENE